MRSRGLLICPAGSQVIIPARAPLSTPPGPVLLPRPVPSPVHLVPGLVLAVLLVLALRREPERPVPLRPVPLRPVPLRPVPPLPVLPRLVLAFLLAQPVGLARRGRGRGSRRVGRRM